MRRVAPAEDLGWLPAALLFFVLAVSHIVQIGIWAVAVFASVARPGFDGDGALDHTLTTYRTVGYGDVTLGANTTVHRDTRGVCWQSCLLDEHVTPGEPLFTGAGPPTGTRAK